MPWPTNRCSPPTNCVPRRKSNACTKLARPSFRSFRRTPWGVKAKDDDTRLAAIGGITNPTILSRQSDGGLLSQLITDFGRTYFLTTSARSNALSATQRAEVARQTLLFRVDQAYFAAQGAQALVSVANQTVSTNQVLLDRTHALAVSNLKSSLDVSFAQVGLAQARLLQIQARARLQESFAELSASLGIGEKDGFHSGANGSRPRPARRGGTPHRRCLGTPARSSRRTRRPRRRRAFRQGRARRQLPDDHGPGGVRVSVRRGNTAP